jgi:hypothetical protein
MPSLKKIIPGAMMLLFLLPLQQCKDCNTYTLTFSFTQADLAVVPYAGDEVITLKNTTGDSLIFACNGRVNIKDNPIEVPGSGCDKSTYHLPTNTTVFISGTDSIGLQLYLQMLSTTVARKIFHIGITDLKSDSIKGFSWNFGFDADTIIVYPNYTAQTDGAVAYYDSLTVISKKYHRVYELMSRVPPVQSYEFVRSVYYTLADGIIGLQTNQGHRWETK